MLPYPPTDHPPLNLTEQNGATKYLSLEHLGFKDETKRAREKRQIPEAMEEIEERKTSTEQIWPGRTDSGRHNAGAGGEEQGGGGFGSGSCGWGITPHTARPRR